MVKIPDYFKKHKFNSNFSRYYELFTSVASLGEWKRVLRRTLDQKNIEVKKAVDLGCGPGYIAFELKKRFPKAEVAGVDLSKEMIEICNKKRHCNR